MSVWAVAAAVTAVVGAGISAVGAYEQGQATKEANKINAQNAQNAAQAEAEASAENARRSREENERRLGAIKAQMAASGVQIGMGSALDVMSESADELELATLDAFTASENRQRQLQNQASLDLFTGDQAAKVGTISAGGSLLSGFGSAFSGYASNQRLRTFRT